MTALLLITGIGADGRSCAARNSPVNLHADTDIEGIAYAQLYETPRASSIEFKEGRTSSLYELGVPVGAVSWKMVEYAPEVTYSMHYTDSIDMDIVMSGSADLVLGDGVHHLCAGDSVVITGVDHAWRAGPEGCRISVISLGARSPQ